MDNKTKKQNRNKNKNKKNNINKTLIIGQVQVILNTVLVLIFY